MNVEYAVCTHFDSSSEMNYKVDRTRAKRTVENDDWWLRRLEIWNEFVEPSLHSQTFQDFGLWGFFNEHCFSDTGMRHAFRYRPDGGNAVSGGPRMLRQEYYNRCDWLCMILHDSDDLYSPGAFDLIAKQKPEPGLVVYFEDGWMYDINTGRIDKFITSHGAGPGPWIARWYPNEALASEEAWWSYRFKWKFNRVHHQVRGCPNARKLPHWNFLALLHGSNVTRRRGNPATEKKANHEVTDPEKKQKILLRFGIHV